ncbi:SRPBCC family protein [Pseudofrankia asymbiotica]|uniref:SRPBCC family protein n=1 Tax=Pseudofrankia asymbiotica TaxID=1834516 RepID=UPI0009784689|nr:SRPBCC family protein [Pseudofrankia asymbiotica]
MNTIDPVATAGLVAREVRSGSRNGTPTKIAVARRTYRTDQADLWDAVTNIDRIPRWFLPVSGELALGGRYQLEGNAGGIVERCDEPASFAVTWEFGGTVSWLNVTLTPAGGGTVLELVHESPVDPDFWKQFGPGAVGVGWDLGLMGLGLYLDTGVPVDPAEAAAFTVSPDGVEFVRHSAAGWADAAVSDGDEPGAAHEAAARTATFYTVVPDDAAPKDAAPKETAATDATPETGETESAGS